MDTLGTAKPAQTLTGALETYQVWCGSPGAFSDPDNATGVNVQPTGSLRDLSQKNFEILIQSIGLRASPVILGEPSAVADLAQAGAAELTGEGFTWCFGVERAQVFDRDGDPVALLREEIAGIVLATGVIIVTSGSGQNMEFARKETAC